MIDILFLIGRIVLGVYLLFNGYNHFKRLRMLSGYAASKGVPFPSLAVSGTGAMLLVAGFDIITGINPVAGIILVVWFMVPVAFLMHNWWTISDLPTRGSEFVNFTKNLAIAAMALMLLAVPLPWPYSLG